MNIPSIVKISDKLNLIEWEYSQENSLKIFKLFNTTNSDALKYMDYELHDSIEISKSFLKQKTTAENLYYFIYCDSDTIGFIGLNNINIKHNFAYISCMLIPQYQKKGIMLAILNNFCTYVFNNTNLIRIEAQVHEHNFASIKLLSSCGFTNEGTMRKNFKIGKEYFNSKLFSILNPKYE